jgi:antitoxin VapB
MGRLPLVFCHARRNELTSQSSVVYTLHVPIYITNQEAEDLARELSAVTGETITDTVLHALRERRDRLRAPSRKERIARLMDISDRAAAIIAGRPIDVDHLYDEWGLPK